MCRLFLKVIKCPTFLTTGQFLMSVLIKPVNLKFSAEVSVLFLVFEALFWLSWPVRSVAHPPSQADLLSRSHQFLCGLIRLIRTCASFQGTQALGVVEGTEASSQDLSTPYPAAGKTSQGQPGGGLLWEGCQQLQSASSLLPPTLPSFLSGSQHNWQGGYKQNKTAWWQTFGEI